MPRTKGAGDLKKRKKREFYAGKPIKKKRRNRAGNFVPYKSKRGRSDPLRVRFQEKKPMSKAGYNRWSRKMRKHIEPIIRPFVKGVFLIEPDMLSTPDKIGEISIDILQKPGTFNLLMPSASKSSFRVSYKKRAIVKIAETDNSLHAEVTDYGKMRKYWFWLG